jgi:hypothetical protein
MGMSGSYLPSCKSGGIKGMLGMEDEADIEIPGRLRIRNLPG